MRYTRIRPRSSGSSGSESCTFKRYAPAAAIADAGIVSAVTVVALGAPDA